MLRVYACGIYLLCSFQARLLHPCTLCCHRTTILQACKRHRCKRTCFSRMLKKETRCAVCDAGCPACTASWITYCSSAFHLHLRCTGTFHRRPWKMECIGHQRIGIRVWCILETRCICSETVHAGVIFYQCSAGEL